MVVCRGDSTGFSVDIPETNYTFLHGDQHTQVIVWNYVINPATTEQEWPAYNAFSSASLHHGFLLKFNTASDNSRFFWQIFRGVSGALTINAQWTDILTQGTWQIVVLRYEYNRSGYDAYIYVNSTTPTDSVESLNAPSSSNPSLSIEFGGGYSGQADTEADSLQTGLWAGSDSAFVVNQDGSMQEGSDMYNMLEWASVWYDISVTGITAATPVLDSQCDGVDQSLLDICDGFGSLDTISTDWESEAFTTGEWDIFGVTGPLGAGLYGAKSDSANAIAVDTVGLRDEHWIKALVRYPTTVDSAVNIGGWRGDAGEELIRLYFQSGNIHAQILSDASTSPQTLHGHSQLSTFSWYEVRAQVITNNDSGAVRVWIDDTLSIHDSWIDTKNAEQIAQVVMGFSSGGQDTSYFDYFKADSARTFPNFNIVDRPNGITFWRQQSAFYSENTNRTYIAFADTASSTTINTKVMYYDHTDHVLSSPTTLESGFSVGDPHDHCVPDMIVLRQQGDNNDGKLVVAYESGSGVAVLRSDSPEDISAFTTEATLDATGATYPNILEGDNGNLLVLFRDSSDDGYYSLSTDGGDTWGSKVELINFNTSTYMKADYADSCFHVMAVDHSSGDHKNIFYMQSTNNGSTWKERDGTSITLPATAVTLDTVWLSAMAQETRDSDICVNPDDSRDAYLLFVDDQRNGDNPNGEGWFTYAYWTGSAWATEDSIAQNITFEDFTTISHTFGALDPARPDSIMWIVVEDSTAMLQKWVRQSADNWVMAAKVTPTFGQQPYNNNARPVFVKNSPLNTGDSKLSVIFCYIENFVLGNANDRLGDYSELRLPLEWIPSVVKQQRRRKAVQ